MFMVYNVKRVSVKYEGYVTMGIESTISSLIYGFTRAG